MKNIIKKLKRSKLKGRGGAGFPTGSKWEMVKKEKSDKKYIICNGSEGDPNVFKDGFILDNYLDEVVNGVKVALNTFKNSQAYFYLRKDYYKKYGPKIKSLTKDLNTKIFKKSGGYLGGEETSLIENIEGNLPIPRIKPPFPTTSGLYGAPTLVNNVETFYHISKVSKGEYNKTRFYTISGDIKNGGVYELSINNSVYQILKKTNNLPDFDFFAQVENGIMGKILTPDELDKPIQGLGSIVVFNKNKTDPFKLMEKWVKFFLKSNCDKCVPCREGMFRLAYMIEQREIDNQLINDLFFVLKNTSFCALGKGSVIPFKTLIEKIINEKE